MPVRKCCHAQKKPERRALQTAGHICRSPASIDAQSDNLRLLQKLASLITNFERTHLVPCGTDTGEQLREIVDAFDRLLQQLVAQALGLRGFHVESGYRPI